jgi:hypothetical protein
VNFVVWQAAGLDAALLKREGDEVNAFGFGPAIMKLRS